MFSLFPSSFYSNAFYLSPMEAIQPLGRTTFGKVENEGRVLTENEALKLLYEWVENDKLRLHMKQVAAVMKDWALEKEQLPEEVAHKWWLAGLLHDADWDKYPNEHCRIIIEELEKRNIDPSIIQCIASHGPRHFGVEPQSRMDHMIYVFDELSGFIHAAALIRPARYEDMDVKSVQKKLKTPSFAAQVSRDDISDALKRAGLEADEIIQFIIEHQKHI
ncbi:MAG: HD domain-containing protein [Flavisolibacter sp.]